VFSALKSIEGRRYGSLGGRWGVFVMVKWKWMSFARKSSKGEKGERLTIWIFI
jgi:hypothetical protein